MPKEKSKKSERRDVCSFAERCRDSKLQTTGKSRGILRCSEIFGLSGYQFLGKTWHCQQNRISDKGTKHERKDWDAPEGLVSLRRRWQKFWGTRRLSSGTLHRTNGFSTHDRLRVKDDSDVYVKLKSPLWMCVSINQLHFIRCVHISCMKVFNYFYLHRCDWLPSCSIEF